MNRDFNIHDHSDILDIPRPTFASHKKMSMVERGAQFSPFAALTGYEEAVEETARLTDRETVLTEEAKAMVDAKLRIIAEQLRDLPQVANTPFVPAKRKTGGAYAVTIGTVRELDTVGGYVVMADRKRIAVESIRDISFEA